MPFHGPLTYPVTSDSGLTLDQAYRDLQEDEPVCPVRMRYGGNAWFVSRYADAKAVLADPRFSRARTLFADIPRMSPEPDEAVSILSMDPPDHTRMRRLVVGSFTRKRIEALRPRTQRHVDEVLDALAASGTPADVVQHLGLTLPINVICELLGVPVADRDEFIGWSNAAVPPQTTSKAELDHALHQLTRYIGELVALRPTEPQDDILNDLVAARDERADRLSEDELTFLRVTVLVTGHETTKKAIGDAVCTLLTDDRAREAIRAAGAVSISAVDDLLRFIPLETSAEIFRRVATCDVVLGGVTLRKSDTVFTHLSVANRDLRVFDHLDELDLGRSPNPHLAFGHGLHLCLGHHLGRIEVQVAVNSLFRRLPHFALAEDPAVIAWKLNGFVRDTERLLVSW